VTTTLRRELRDQLKNAVREARHVAEEGAAKVLKELGVAHGKAPTYLLSAQIRLRNALRAHGRQVGDHRNGNTGAQSIGRLTSEVAYEHWHRMLFARFLAENDLLIEPDSAVAITLAECQELARERNEDWLGLASSYAQTMLPEIFRADDPILEVQLPPENRLELDDLLKGLPHEIFTAADALGWVYQFWQADSKETINHSEARIGADELPPVTQLFTEDYMVWFLLHNTLGAWWAAKVLAAQPQLAANARNEAELRAACAVGDVEWTYLRFVREDDNHWRPAAGTFEGWPRNAKDITLLDPCMGSGHFLVFALPILAAMRANEESLSTVAAIDAVLRDNLFGLEIDVRCTQIAAFNLALAAWRRVGYRTLPRPHLACSGLSIGITKADWQKLASKALAATRVARQCQVQVPEFRARAERGLELLYEMFAKAPLLGSLINPRQTRDDLFVAGFRELEQLFSVILTAAVGDDAEEMFVAAQGMTKAAELLSRRFTLVATNVPYLVRGKQGDGIREFCADYAPEADRDLATVFLKRCADFSEPKGTYAVVAPTNWLSLKSYKSFRKMIVDAQKLNFIAKVGSGATAKASWDTLRALTIITMDEDNETYFAAGCETSAVTEADRALALRTESVCVAARADLRSNPDTAFSISGVARGALLGQYAESIQGPSTGDFPRFGRYFWEVANWGPDWEFQQTSIAETEMFAGCKFVVRWEGGSGDLARHPGAAIRGTQAFGRRGVVVTQMRSLPSSLFVGRWFDNNVAVLLPKKEQYLGAIWTFCSSAEFSQRVRRVDDKLGVTNASLTKIEFDFKRWSGAFEQQCPLGLPRPKSRNLNEWVFDGSVVDSKLPLLGAVALLVGFRWPRQAGVEFLDCPAVQAGRYSEHNDQDGIVCVSATKGKPPADERLNALLSAVYGAEWSAGKLTALLSEVGFSGKSLDDWLRDGLFEQHCAHFHQRPFVWHVWDGRRDGFHAFVNYHRLAAPKGEGRRTLEKLLYSYLGDWIDVQRRGSAAGVEGADARLAAAAHLKGELEKILAGEPPYDLFVRWKPLGEQAIGWEPDINDGVRVNIRPFMTARPFGARAKHACILRTTPHIKWEKDRGKEPQRPKEDFPWFWGWDEATQDFAGGDIFDGKRWNGLHYSNKAKRAAREARSRSAR
jgi:hypothetical protein